MTLKSKVIDTPLGPMVAVADERALHVLEFADRSDIPAGETAPLRSIEQELRRYFSGQLRQFATSLTLQGTPFQKRVWEELQKIPYGETRSYAAIAATIGRPTAFRAVAQANGANRIAIVIPCHRVINSTGALGGYNSGIERKAWLLQKETSK
jgi:AraC family transcriptional regulator of adaptative response/methylated-DNA-[protein]-cysteine methyltransferase